ncbi:MAG: hypothetical protein KDD62_00330 [Bdellovibrionales bacterium]|nr:hypothetical protein [Bdellovibrionales bacterium]
MKTYDHYRRLRESKSRDLDSTLQSLIKSIQTALAGVVVDVISDLVTDQDGAISTTVGNVTKQGRIGLVIKRETKRQAPRLIDRIVKGLGLITRLNRLYFRAMPDVQPESVDERVIRKVLLRYGYDATTKQVLPGGWLDSLSDNSALEQRVGNAIRQAIAAKTPLNDFKKQFRADFTGANGLGYLEKHYETFVFDLHQQVDRQTQVEYADRLKLNHALYSGTIKDNTRPFCKARTGLVYTRDEIAGWENLNFQGKIKVGYNPFVHAGGYNCRHHLSWVSELVAIRIAKGEKNINKYN